MLRRPRSTLLAGSRRRVPREFEKPIPVVILTHGSLLMVVVRGQSIINDQLPCISKRDVRPSNPRLRCFGS